MRDLSTAYDLVPAVTSDAAAAIVVGDRLPDDPPPDSLIVATVSLAAPIGSGVRIVRGEAPRDVPAGTAIHLGVELEASGAGGRTTDVIVAAAGVETGRASHRWTGNAERWLAGIDAVPIGDPPYVLQVRLEPETSDAPVADPDTAGTVIPGVSGFPGPPKPRRGEGGSPTSVDVVVDVRREPIRVQFYEPRPSWSTTFLRRALEADARFEVASLSYASKGVAVQTGSDVPLADTRLDAFDVVIVGGLDRLTAADAGALERFMRERGGAVVVVPDQRFNAGPARDLIAGASGSVRPSASASTPLDYVERLLEQPAKLAVAFPAASIRVSELLVLPTLPPGVDAIARVPGGDRAPVIVSMPRGDGRLVVSGAMDAWRFRAADGGAFDRFWQSTIAGLAMRVRPPIAIDVIPPLLSPGERGDVVVRTRTHDAGVSASIDGEPIRLTPEPEAGAYRGRFTAKRTPGRSTVAVQAGSTASRTILVRSDVRRARGTPAPSLSMLASSHRGVDVAPDRLGDLERFLRSTIVSPRAATVRHPMRSTWWLLPFAACLSAEWWVRRRKGLR
jgi:hypothetical protein